MTAGNTGDRITATRMGEKIFLDYDEAGLDRAYDQRVWAPDADAIIARYGTASEAARRSLAWRTHAYGSGARETFDVFPAGPASAPTAVFVHGGAWRALSKAESAFAAPALVAAGINFVALDFDAITELSLPGMVRQVRTAVAALHRDAPTLGIAPDRIHLIGHSSGAHLAAAALITGDIPPDAVRGAVLIGGIYDLVPVMLSARRTYVRLSPEETAALSPITHVERLACRLLIAHGALESPEFQRQSASFAAAARHAGRSVDTMVVVGASHFTAVEALADPGSPLFRAAIALMLAA